MKGADESIDDDTEKEQGDKSKNPRPDGVELGAMNKKNKLN